MSTKWTGFSRKRQFGIQTLAVVALCSLLCGMLTASGLNWTGVSAAQLTPNESRSITPPVVGESFAPLAEKLAPSVVNIRVTKIENAGMQSPQMPDGQFGDLFKEFFGRNFRLPQSQPMQGAGSGVIISDDGYILTNNHVVEGARELTVTMTDKTDYPAEVVGRDPKTDLAVVKIAAGKSLPAAKLGDSDHLQVGDWVIAIGNPFGLSHTVTSGIVSAKGRVIGAGPYDNFIQTDASINPGNSGGPLFNMNGEVVGINTAIIPNGQGIGFAIPVDTAKPLIPQLVKDGKVKRGYLGVNIQNVTPELAKALQLKNDTGALVADVLSGSPAEQAGVVRGDVIVAFNGKAVKESHNLPALVAAAPIGEKSSVTLVRKGVEKNLNVTIAESPADDNSGESPAKPAEGKWGLQLQNLTPQIAQQLGVKQGQGVVVVEVQPGSPADKSSLNPGDVILEVNRAPVRSVDDVMRAMNKAGDKNSLLLLVQRDQKSRFVALTG